MEQFQGVSFINDTVVLVMEYMSGGGLPLRPLPSHLSPRLL